MLVAETFKGVTAIVLASGSPRRRELRPSGGAVVPVGRRRAEQREKEPEGERVRRGAARHVLFSLMQATSGENGIVMVEQVSTFSRP